MSISSDYLSLQPSYYIDLNEDNHLFDHHQVIGHHTTPFSFSNLQPHLSSSASSLSSSSSSSSFYNLNSAQDQAGFCYMGSQIQPYPYQQEVENLSLYGSGSYDHTTLEINKKANNGLKFSICKKEDKNFGVEYGGGSGVGEINGSPIKWMSSKMRLMKKMMKTEEDHKAKVDHSRVDNTLAIKSSNNGSSNNNNNNNESATIRVCSDCNTTKTPLWRSGPRGPKSLCNACGIRQRKARRAMAAAAAAGSGSMLPNTPPSSKFRAGNNHKKASNINNNGFGAQKKRSKMTKPSRDQRKLCFEEFALSLTKKLSIQHVFPQEEKEAAILLMALSCGLVRG
ncbi:hypothetical protein V2J09_012344 [Rumex salicifolius]